MKTLNSCSHKTLQYHTFTLFGLFLSAAALQGQPDRIVGQISNEERVVLAGNVHRKALPQFDKGPVEPSMKLDYITLMLESSASQQAALEPQYHTWLTPEQYADRFGLSPADVGKISAWLESQGFSINHVARSRNWIAFSGTAAQVMKAFQTEIDYYSVDGEMHFANASEPAIPAAIESLVIGFFGLDNFYPKTPRPRVNVPTVVGERGFETPDFTQPDGTHFLGPDDVAHYL
jgi:hypothetical protein